LVGEIPVCFDWIAVKTTAYWSGCVG